jgi:4-amino-4-deoxy-L-arabinose transferase-like glycosyltransferase
MQSDDRTFPARDLWLLAFAAAVLLLPNLSTREVRGTEALYAGVASDMVRTGALWATAVHGAPVEAYPGYAWLVAAGQVLGLAPEAALRLPAALCLVVLAGLCGVVGYRRGGPIAGAVAAAMVLCNPAALRAGTRGQNDSLLALLLCAAWLVWYSLGQRRKRWTLAWIAAMAFVVPAAFTAGARSIALFYLPFIFLRHPVKGRRRLLLPSHLVVLGLTVAGLAFWLHQVPKQIFLPWNEVSTVPRVTVSYPVELLLFPVHCILYLMPWPFLCWPAFCMAYRPLERSPVIFHYLRTIVVSSFLAVWLIPDLSPLVLLPVLGPLAIMTGLHAELLVRRHHHLLRRLSIALLAVAMVVAVFGILAAALHLAGIVYFEGMETGLLTWNAAFLLALLVLALLAWRGPLRSLACHAHLVVAFITLACSVVTLRTVWYAWASNEQRAAGLALAGKIPPPDFMVVKPAAPAVEAGTGPAPTATPVAATPAGPAGTAPELPLTYRPLSESIVYRQTVNYYLSVCFYLGRPVVRVLDPKTQIPLPVPGPRQVLGAVATAAPPGSPDREETPATYRDAVYALCDGGAPVLPAVEWTAITPPIDLRRRKDVRVQWFPGGMTVLRLYTEAAPLPEKPKPVPAATPAAGEEPSPETPPSEIVQLYRGVRR